jgi:lysophospholipase L1-like esterase
MLSPRARELRPSHLAAVLAAVLVLGSPAAPGATAPVRLKLDYRIPPRYGLDRNKDGLVDSITSVDQVDLRTWSALVTVRWPSGGRCDGTYSWTVDGRPAAFVRQRDLLGRPTCVFSYAGFRTLDRPYRVAVTARRGATRGRGETRVTVRDLLVVGLGDSTASGEGNPDSGVGQVRWQDKRCHRSSKGFEALTASRLESASDKSSVTYVPLACSGASIANGMLGGYAGAEPGGAPPLPGQIEAMKSLIGSRKPDAVVVSIGINDLGYGNIARFCFDDGVDAAAAAAVDCWSKPYPNASSSTTLLGFVRARAAALTDRYAQLAVAFQKAGIPASKIYVTEYPNATRDANGVTCNPLIGYLDGRPFGYNLRGTITRAEAAQAETEVLQPVNKTLQAAATTFGWHLVPGIATASLTHGLCAGKPWFVGVFESLVGQHDVQGTLHPNGQGQQAIANAVVAALELS